MDTLRQLFKQFRALRVSLSLKFVIGVAVTLMITMGTSYYFITKNHEKLIRQQVDLQARALFRQIVLTRKWIADHGGIFVEKVPWREPSPYLEESEIVDVTGRRYLKKSPAMVTKELSRYAREKGLFWFHITSLKLINPENAPDSFERKALGQFETLDVEEMSTIEKIGSSRYFRYIAPLYIEKPCLACHGKQGYKVGDVRGAISVTVPMDYASSMIKSVRNSMLLASIATVTILVFILYIMMKELVLSPVQQLKTSMKDFSRGEQSITSIISTGDELEDLSNSFAEMSESLTRYHLRLENEVQRATRGLEEANRQLTELNERKSEFIAQISHELRTPMTSIKGAMDYISSRISKMSKTKTEAGDIAEFLDVIRNNADRLVRLVSDTLDLERIESGMFDLHFEKVDMLSLIKEVIIGFQSITGEKNITFRIAAHPQKYVRADEDRIRQVLINLVSNAINYSPDDSEIEISVEESDKSLTVSVKDEGPGIPDDVSEKIFDKFYTIGKRHGTGLGLAICKGIIEAHNGEIGVQKGLAGGSAIYFRLPKNATEPE